MFVKYSYGAKIARPSSSDSRNAYSDGISRAMGGESSAPTTNLSAVAHEQATTPPPKRATRSAGHQCLRFASITFRDGAHT